MKRIISLIAIFLVCLTLSSCQKEETYEFTDHYIAEGECFRLVKDVDETYNIPFSFIVKDFAGNEIDCSQVGEDTYKYQQLDLVMVAVGSEVEENISEVIFDYDNNIWTATVHLSFLPETMKFEFDVTEHTLEEID